jgi:transcriptional regulator with XRE-family HTH domain
MLNLGVSSKLFGKGARLRAMSKQKAERAQTPLGKRIQAEREARGWTQAELGKRCAGPTSKGLTKGAVSQWENGTIKNIRLDTFFRLADALGLEPRWLATEKGLKYSSRKGDPVLDELLSIYDSLDSQGRGIVLIGAKTAKTDYDQRNQQRGSNASQA